MGIQSGRCLIYIPTRCFFISKWFLNEVVKFFYWSFANSKITTSSLSSAAKTTAFIIRCSFRWLIVIYKLQFPGFLSPHRCDATHAPVVFNFSHSCISNVLRPYEEKCLVRTEGEQWMELLNWESFRVSHTRLGDEYGHPVLITHKRYISP